MRGETGLKFPTENTQWAAKPGSPEQAGYCPLTSPHPLADVTRLRAMLIEPPPFPFWVERLPDSIAVSVAVRGAWKRDGL